MGTLKRKKKHSWRLSVEVITTEKTYSGTYEVQGSDPFDDDNEKLFAQLGVPEDMEPDALLGMTFKVERL